MIKPFHITATARQDGHSFGEASSSRYPREQQWAFILARLRSYGPAFGCELIDECRVTDPAARVKELCAEGYHIEVMRAYRAGPDGSRSWDALYAMQLKDPDTGALSWAPAPLGTSRLCEQWTG